jgi:hypothetical protein
VGADPVIFHGGFAVGERHHDVAVLRRVLLADDDGVSRQDGGVLHAVALDAQGEKFGAAGQVPVHGQVGLDVLLRQHRQSGADLAHQRDLDGGLPLQRHQPAVLQPALLQRALLLQSVQVGLDGPVADAELLRDLAKRWGHGGFLQFFSDVFEYLGLPLGQLVHG